MYKPTLTTIYIIFIIYIYNLCFMFRKLLIKLLIAHFKHKIVSLYVTIYYNTTITIYYNMYTIYYNVTQ